MAKIDKNRLACEHFWGSVGPTSMPQIASSSFFGGGEAGVGLKTGLVANWQLTRTNQLVQTKFKNIILITNWLSLTRRFYYFSFDLWNYKK